MNPEDILKLGRAVAAICPAQKWDEHSPAAWLELLGDLRYEDARQAVFNLGRQQPFIAPSDIIKEVKRIREERIKNNPLPDPPDDLTVPQFIAWKRLTLKAVADGEVTFDPRPELERGYEPPPPPPRVQELVSGAVPKIVEPLRVIDGETA